MKNSILIFIVVCMSINQSIFAQDKGIGTKEEAREILDRTVNLMKSNKSSHSIGIGLIESSQVFFEARAKDAEKLINSPCTKQLDQILSRAVRSIERL